MSESRKATRKKVLAAMSGGVDSSVAAMLLCEAGFDVTGMTMCLGLCAEAGRASCCGGDAVEDARHVCGQLGITHFVFDFSQLMESLVIDKFIDEYFLGRTPNPCVDCNRYLKFGALLDKARAMGFDYLATGHYARIEYTDDRWKLLRAQDSVKDQSYFLFAIRAEDLPMLLFPLGNMTKEQVRQKAKEAGLHTAQKAESQDICFVPEGDYERVFAERGRRIEPGDITNLQGKILGKHRGIVNYTIGQRGGLGISAKRPLYVLKIDAQNNRVVVGEKEELFSSGLIAEDLNLLTSALPDEAEGKIRYRKKAARCLLRKVGDKLKVTFDEPQEAITPGQSFVFYSGDEVLGGGVIERAL